MDANRNFQKEKSEVSKMEDNLGLSDITTELTPQDQNIPTYM